MKETRCYGCMKLKTSGPICEHCGYDARETNAPHQIPVGTVLKEQYLVGRVLGQGGFGITYLGWDMYLDIPVAIKEYYPTGVVMRENSQALTVSCGSGGMGERFQENRKRFLREAKALARFANVPQIVQVSNYFLANNTAYIVMEYVEGITLKQHVKNRGGRLSVQETFALLRPVIEALGKVHETGLVHRDISPDNIMLLPGGGVKVIDFGAVRDVHNADAEQPLTKSTEAILKQGYAPIEQYQKRGSLGPWTDVYALCATIYYCLTGQVPPDAPERVLGEVAVEWSKIPGLGQEQAEALEKGMELFPKNRIQSMKELAEGLFPRPVPQPVEPEPVKAETQVKTEPAPKPEEPKQKPKKKWLLPVIAAAAAVAVGAALFLGGKEEAVATPDNAITGQCGENLSWTLDPETGAMTVEGDGDMADYSGEAAPWSQYQTKITHLTVGENVASIGDNAFENCENLTSADIGGSVKIIGSDAFRGTGLTEVTLPDSVTDIESRAFMDTRLTGVTLGEGLETIGTQAFGNCPDLAYVEFQSNPVLLEHWDDRIFTADEEKEPPEGLELRCDYGTFAWAYGMHYGIPCVSTGRTGIIASGQCGQDMTWTLFEGGVLVLDGSGAMTQYNALYMPEEDANQYSERRTLPPWTDYYDQIRLLYVGNGVTTISRGAFYNCKTLQYLYLSEETLSYDYPECVCNERTFEGSGLVQVEMPEIYSSYTDSAFNNCESLEYLKLSDGQWGNTSCLWEWGALTGCTSLQKLVVPWNVYFGAMGLEATPEGLTIYSRPGGSVEAFCEANGVNFVAEIDGMGLDEFGQCGDEVFWAYSRENKTLFLYTSDGKDGARSRCDTWNFGGDSYPEFYRLKDEVEAVRINGNITSLGDYLFRDMTSLKTVDTTSYWNTTLGTDEEWRDNSDIDRVGNGVFSGCTSLESFVFPTGTKTYGKAIFENCTSLRYVAIGWGVLPAGTFTGCPALEELVLHLYASFDEKVFGTGTAAEHPENLMLYVWEGSIGKTLAKNYDIPYTILTLE